MTITFQKELFGKIMPELPELFYRHWEEVALDKEAIKLKPDWPTYLQMELLNILHMMTVRAEGKLVGYYIALVRPHLHYAESLTAWSDIFYLLPEYRRGLTGYQLFAETEDMLKKLGVQKSYVMTKAHLPITIIMKRRGYRFIERIYTKLL